MSKEGIYFAFGSNMFTNRMKHRVPSAEVIGVARLDAHCLNYHKRGADSSGKCSIEESEGDAVWGVLYRIDMKHKTRLDSAEGSGYSCVECYVMTPEGRVRAFTYKAKDNSMIEAAPAEWYRDIVLAGAKENGLPPEWCDLLARVAAHDDH